MRQQRKNEGRVGVKLPADVGTQHKHGAVGKVEHVHQAKNKRQAGRHQKEKRAECQA